MNQAVEKYSTNVDEFNEIGVSETKFSLVNAVDSHLQSFVYSNCAIG